MADVSAGTTDGLSDWISEQGSDLLTKFGKKAAEKVSGWGAIAADLVPLAKRLDILEQWLNELGKTDQDIADDARAFWERFSSYPTSKTWRENLAAKLDTQIMANAMKDAKVTAILKIAKMITNVDESPEKESHQLLSLAFSRVFNNEAIESIDKWAYLTVGLMRAFAKTRDMKTCRLRIFLLAPSTVTTSCAASVIGFHLLAQCGARMSPTYDEEARRISAACGPHYQTLLGDEDEESDDIEELTNLHATPELTGEFFSQKRAVKHPFPIVPLLACNSVGSSIHAEATEVFASFGDDRAARCFEIEQAAVMSALTNLQLQEAQLQRDLESGRFTLHTEPLDLEKIAIPTGLTRGKA